VNVGVGDKQDVTWNSLDAFRTPVRAALKCGSTSVGRLIGRPSDWVWEDDHGIVWTRGPNSTKTWFKVPGYASAKVRLADRAHFGMKWQLPPAMYFMIGHNLAQSCDSRTWGGVPIHDIIGTILAPGEEHPRTITVPDSVPRTTPETPNP